MNNGYSRHWTKGDKHYKWAKKQRKKRGFDDTEIASLDVALALHILPRLKRFRVKHQCCPLHLTTEQWNMILDDMIYAFEFTISDDLYEDKARTRVQRGLELFGKYYHSLWT